MDLAAIVRNRVAVVFAVAFMACGLAWRIWVAPRLTALPSDFSFSASVASIDNFYDHERQSFSGEIHSQTKYSFAAKELIGDVLVIENTFDVRKPDSEKIFSVTREYGIDRISRRHVAGYGDESRAGYLFAPRNLKKQDFTYWHINYNTPIVMKYQSTEKLYGLEVYKYSADFQADQTKELSNLPGVGTTKGVGLQVHLDLWVEPVTGSLVNFQDTTQASYYELKIGTMLEPWNTFSNTFTPYSVKTTVALVRNALQSQYLVETIIPISFVIIGFVLLIGSYLFSLQKLPVLVFPLFVFICASILTSIAYFVVQSDVDRQIQLQFASDVHEIELSILNRFQVYTSFLQSGVGLFAASKSVEKDEWTRFTMLSRTQSVYPGIQGLGYARYISRNDRARALAAIQSDGQPSYSVWPEGDREIEVPVTFLEPEDARNKKSIGYDMFSEAIRRAAIEQARDTGEPVLSGKVTLVQENTEEKQPGFLIYMPIYENASPSGMLEERRRSIVGFVYAPFRVNNFMYGIFQDRISNIDFEIHDAKEGEELTDANRLYDADADTYGKDEGFVAQYVSQHTIRLNGHDWTIKYLALPSYHTGVLGLVPPLVLSVGMLLSSLLFVVFYNLASSKKRAESLADRMSMNFRESEQKYRKIFESLTDVLYQTDANGMITMVSPSVRAFVGISPSDVVGRNIQEFFVDEKEREAMNAQLLSAGSVQDFLMRLIGKEGKEITVSVNAKLIVDEHDVSLGTEGVFRDVSERKKTEDVLIQKNRELERMNRLMVDRELRMKELKEELGKFQQHI